MSPLSIFLSNELHHFPRIRSSSSNTFGILIESGTLKCYNLSFPVIYGTIVSRIKILTALMGLSDPRPGSEVSSIYHLDPSLVSRRLKIRSREETESHKDTLSFPIYVLLHPNVGDVCDLDF